MKIPQVKKWLIQGGVATPHLNWHAVHPLTQGLEGVAPGYGFNVCLTFFQEEGERINWVLDEAFMMERGQALVKDLPTIENALSAWKKSLPSFYTQVGRVKKQNSFSLKDYQQFTAAYHNEYSPTFLTEYFTVISDVMIAQMPQGIPRETLGRLTMPGQKTFLSEEEESALRIAWEAKKQGVDRNSFPEIREKHPEIYQKLHAHTQNFYWIQNNYKHTEPLSEDVFWQRIQESCVRLTEAEIKEKLLAASDYEKRFEEDRRRLEKHLQQEDVEKLRLISKVAFWHDQRKKANLIANGCLNKMLAFFANKTKTSLLELQFLLPAEFESFLETNEFPISTVQKRLNGCLHVITPKEETIFVGEEFYTWKRRVLEQSVEKVHDFRGTAASYGKATGRVKVVINPRTAFHEGEVLVAPMTRPDFLPLMKKAVAVVTDEGGITSHAAIISRELGVPCVVGTKIATRVLKDEDIVEVNANHGIVKILKRKTNG